MQASIAGSSLGVRIVVGVMFAVGSAGVGVAQWVEPECQTLLQVVSPTTQDTFGWLVRSVGDVNGDGVPDLATCAPLAGNAAGKVTVHSGADGHVLWTRAGTVTSGVLGFALETLDWNGDGVRDVLATAPFANGGELSIYSGTSGATLQVIDPTNVAGDNFGCTLAVGADFDGDGVDDLAVGSMGFDQPGATNAGRVYVFSGAGGALIETIEAPVATPGDVEFGVSLAFVGDVSVPPDGRAEIVVGHRDASFWNGRAVVVSYDGAASHVLYSVPIGMDFNLGGNRFDGNLDVNGDGVRDFLVGNAPASIATVFSGADGALIRTFDGNGEGGYFGHGELIDDIDGDGCADLLLGARENDTGATNAGRAFLYSGRTGQVVRTMTHTLANRRIVRDARAIGDFDGDGVTDFVLAGTGGGTSGPPGGSFYVVRGEPFVASYCTAMTTSGGCVPAIHGGGTPSLSASTSFSITTDALEPQKLALTIFSTADPIAAPFQGGYLCLGAPRFRLAPANSGGSGPCSGTLGYTLADLLAHPAGGPTLTVPGEVACQTWGRDPADPHRTSLSDALRFQIVP